MKYFDALDIALLVCSQLHYSCLSISKDRYGLAAQSVSGAVKSQIPFVISWQEQKAFWWIYILPARASPQKHFIGTFYL